MPLVLYSAQGYDSTMAKAYTATGAAKVSLVDDSTGNILARIQAEKNNPHWDIVWFDGDGTMRSLADQKLLLTNWTPANSATYTALGKKLVPADHAYFPTGVTAAGVIIYNTKKLTAAQAPKDWTDLLTPRFKNAVAENDPAFSGPAYPYIAGQIYRQGGGNIAKGEAFFTQAEGQRAEDLPDQRPDPPLGADRRPTGRRGAGLRLLRRRRHRRPDRRGLPQERRDLAARRDGDQRQVDAPRGRRGLRQLRALPDGPAEDGPRSQRQRLLLHPADHPGSPRSQRQVRGSSFQSLDPVWAGAHATEIKTWFHSNIVQ